jgi:hypothetical protein
VPMIDVYAAAGTFPDKHQLAVDLAATLMAIEQVPDIPMFRKNTAAFVHDLPSDALANVDGGAPHQSPRRRLEPERSPERQRGARHGSAAGVARRLILLSGAGTRRRPRATIIAAAPLTTDGEQAACGTSRRACGTPCAGGTRPCWG